MSTPFPPGPQQGPPPVPQGQPFGQQPGPPPQAPPGYPFGPGPQHAGPVPPGQMPPGQVPPGAAGAGAPGWAPGQQPGYGGQPPASAPPSPDRIRRIAQILCPIFVIAGLSIPDGGSVGWADYTLWALFAAAVSLVQLVTLSSNRSPGQSAVVATIATGALVAYWVVIVLPGISSNGGFLQTIGVGCAAVAAWLGSGRR